MIEGDCFSSVIKEGFWGDDTRTYKWQGGASHEKMLGMGVAVSGRDSYQAVIWTGEPGGQKANEGEKGLRVDQRIGGQTLHNLGAEEGNRMLFVQCVDLV